MQSISREDAESYEFGPDADPVLTVEPGESFRIETWDARQGSMYEHGTGPFDAGGALAVDADANPVAGPIHVEGASDGDVLAVHVESIDTDERAWTAIREGTGVLHDRAGWDDCRDNHAQLLSVETGPSGTTADGTAVLETGDRRFEWSLDPHVGTIVTAPRRRAQHTLTSQGPWGGNLDCREVAPGNVVHLNSFTDGGMLYLGDVHASQGDGELTGAAAETAAEVVCSVEVLEDRRVPGVLRVETPDRLVQVDSATRAGSAQNALDGAYVGLLEWLVEDHDLDERTAYHLLSVHPGVETRIYQYIPDPFGFVVCGVSFPRAAL